MKKKMLVLLILCLSLCGCYRNGSLGQTKLYNIAAIVEAGVPYGFTRDTAFDEIKLLETDNYGRTLYQYCRYTQKLEFYVICQKTNEPYAYYYEDMCYLVHYDQQEAFTPEEISWLKEANDWNNPLVESKMRAVNYVNIETDVEMRQDVIQVIRNRLNSEGTAVNIGVDGLETDAEGRKLLLVFVYDENNTTDQRQMYLALVRYANGVILSVFQQIDPTQDIRFQIVEFKQTYKTGDGSAS